MPGPNGAGIRANLRSARDSKIDDMPVVTRDVRSNATATRDRPLTADSIATDSLVPPTAVGMNENASRVHPNAVDLTATDSPVLQIVIDGQDVASKARDMIEAASPVLAAGN